MTREKYTEIYKAEPDEINLTNEDIKEWLDNLIDARSGAGETAYDLCWGRLNKEEGKYEKRISISPCSAESRIQLSTGIQFLVTALDYGLNIRGLGDSKYKYWFLYKGVAIFQVVGEEGLK